MTNAIVAPNKRDSVRKSTQNTVTNRESILKPIKEERESIIVPSPRLSEFKNQLIEGMGD